MKTKRMLTWVVSLLVFIILGGSCQKTEEDIFNDPFPEVQTEITKLLDEIYQSGQQKNYDLLQSFHAYGPKFTEFKDGELRGDTEINQKGERESFEAISDFKYDLRDLKVNVYGDVAIATFHGFFEGKMGDQPLAVQLQSTLVFAKTDNSWKIIHEHFSPLNTAAKQE